MFRSRSSVVFLLLALQWAAGSCSQWCQAPERMCDFVCDCSDCSDEKDCGYNGKDFVCDFEDVGMCGWNDPSSSGTFRWERLQGGDILLNSGPSSDYTTGTSTGWFMGVSAVTAESPDTAVLISPKIQLSSQTCRLHLRYFLWDTGLTGLGAAPLWATIHHHDSQQAVVWRPEVSSAHGWREATIFLGHISKPFQIHFNSQRSEGQTGNVAIDQLEFLDCALPLPLVGKACPAGMLKCHHGGCVEQQQVCDGSDDCGDGTDEKDCDYRLCDFEQDWCDWDSRSLSDLKWIRTNQMSISLTNPLKGPGRDHSENSATGYFLYVTVPDDGSKQDWAAFQSPSLEPTNTSHPCKMVMYTHQFGPRSGGLTVMVADRAIYPVWERGGSLGDLWVKAEVEIVTNTSFQILIMAAIRNFEYGGIAIDSILLSSECRLSSDNSSAQAFPESPKDPCTEPEKLCDFHADCDGEADEATCGDFTYPEGSSGWTDTSIGSQGWTLYKTKEEEYLYLVPTPGQQLTDAQTRTPLMGPTGPACSMTFDFALIGNPHHIGELSVRLIDSVMGVCPKMWEYSGKTSSNSTAWQSTEIPIGFRKNRFQVAFEARAMKLCSCVRIKVKKVHFHGCHAQNYPSSPTGLSCNFETGLCGWFQDNDDNFDWTELEGVDHTTGVGKSLVVDMWSPSLRGMFGRLVSFPQSPGSTEHCLSFFYKLYGPNPGTLNVKMLHKDGHETVIWSRTGSDGNMWHEADCRVKHQTEDYQLVFEAVRSGFDGRVAIDDVFWLDKPCGMARRCSFEGNLCGYTSSGKIAWLHLSGQSTSTYRPQNDHTLESSLGFYMLADTSDSSLPSGASTVLTSPVRHGTSKTECLNLWYHTGGVNPGSLTVYMRPIDGQRVKVFSTSLNTGHVWRNGNGNIISSLMDWQLEFEVTGRGGKDTHIAIDDIFLSPHPCEEQGSLCTLEHGMCSWSNTQNIQVDELDWQLTSQEQDQHYPTPLGDHTLMTEKGHFLSLPSGDQTPAMQRAHLLSPFLPSTKGTCLRFWVFKTHPVRRQLSVWRLSNGRLNQLLELNDIWDSWESFEVDITSTEDYQIVFQGIKGQSGVLALDDIEYTVGINCKNEVTDTTATDNTGGIVASIIVVTLIIVTLIGLLIYYLRNREKHGHMSSSSSNGGFGNDSYDGADAQDHVTVPSS
ncbi:unnamed protein product [Ophioblennius macclurei]